MLVHVKPPHMDWTRMHCTVLVQDVGSLPTNSAATGGVAPAAHKRARKRALQRWHALLHQRIGTRHGMTAALGAHWAAFVDYADRCFKPAFVQAFCPGNGTLLCKGRIDGTCD